MRLIWRPDVGSAPGTVQQALDRKASSAAEVTVPHVPRPKRPGLQVGTEVPPHTYKEGHRSPALRPGGCECRPAGWQKQLRSRQAPEAQGQSPSPPACWLPSESTQASDARATFGFPDAKRGIASVPAGSKDPETWAAGGLGRHRGPHPCSSGASAVWPAGSHPPRAPRGHTGHLSGAATPARHSQRRTALVQRRAKLATKGSASLHTNSSQERDFEVAICL